MGLASDAAVANVALLRVGQRQLIDSLDEPTTEAQVCKALFAQARDATLEGAWWAFVTRRQVLALTPQVRSGWTFVYALPSGCVAPRYIWAGVRNPPDAGAIPFAIEASDDGASRVLLTDQPLAELIYTGPAPAPALWSASFTEAVAWRLAADLVLSLPVKPALASNAIAMAARTLAVAQSVERAQGHHDVEPDAEAIRARG